MTATLICADCGVTCERTGPTQRMCVRCSTERHLERQRLWAKDNPPSKERREKSQSQRAVNQLARATELSTSERWSIGTVPEEAPPLGWVVKVAIPFSYAASKNYIWGFSKTQGHVFRRKEAGDYRSRITLALRAAVNAAGISVRQRKVWVDVVVQKTNHRGDAVNVVDLVCDAAKDALAVDDRWFAIRRLDWQIVKVDPKIFIGIGQEDGGDQQACSSCGRVLDLDQFGIKRRNKLGIDRICRGCTNDKHMNGRDVRVEVRSA